MFHRLAIHRFGLVLLTTLALNFIALQAAHAATYYVATTGSDSNPGTEAAPFKTILKASKTMSGGDTVYIRAGIYDEKMTHDQTGRGFVFKNGTSKDNMTRFAAYPGEEALAHGYTANDNGKVVIKPSGTPEFVVWFSRRTQYVEVSGLVLDGSNVQYNVVKLDGSIITGENASYNRLLRNEIRNTPASSAILAMGPNEFIGNNIYGSTAYGMYLKGNNGVVEGNIIHDNAGYAIHLFAYAPINGWVIRNNAIFRNGFTYHKEIKPGVQLTRGSNQFYNNLVYNNAGGGVQVGLGASDTFIANNTVYGNGYYGININGSFGGSLNARIINNIAWGNSGSQIINTGTNTTLQNNLTTDPKFVNAAGGDFHLQAGSPAIDAGQTLAEVTNDFAYGVRPWPAGGAYDIGAYEFGSPPGSGPSPPPPSGVPPAVPRPPSTYDPTKSLCPI